MFTGHWATVTSTRTAAVSVLWSFFLTEAECSCKELYYSRTCLAKALWKAKGPSKDPAVTFRTRMTILSWMCSPLIRQTWKSSAVQREVLQHLTQKWAIIATVNWSWFDFSIPSKLPAVFKANGLIFYWQCMTELQSLQRMFADLAAGRHGTAGD